MDVLSLAVEVFTAVEGHVLEEMGEATLAFLFLYGADALGNIKVHTVFGVVVVADVVGQSTVELADSNFGIYWNGSQGLCHEGTSAECH